MAREFLQHTEAEDRRFHGMVENVEPDQPRIQVAVRIFRFCPRRALNMVYHCYVVRWGARSARFERGPYTWVRGRTLTFRHPTR